MQMVPFPFVSINVGVLRDEFFIAEPLSLFGNESGFQLLYKCVYKCGRKLLTGVITHIHNTQSIYIRYCFCFYHCFDISLCTLEIFTRKFKTNGNIMDIMV